MYSYLLEKRQVYYGFTQNFLTWGKLNMASFDEWMAAMRRLLDQAGVIYKGLFQ